MKNLQFRALRMISTQNWLKNSHWNDFFSCAHVLKNRTSAAFTFLPKNRTSAAFTFSAEKPDFGEKRTFLTKFQRQNLRMSLRRCVDRESVIVACGLATRDVFVRMQ
jgi:hypothetical protein